MIAPADRSQQSRAVAVLVIGFALITTLLLSTASPHLHLGRDPGFFNQEHDLSLFVAAGTHAPLPDGLAVIWSRAVSSHTPIVPPLQPASHDRRLADPRAPPLA